jgi:hypothetical protein
MAGPVASQCSGGQLEVPRQVHPDQLGRQEQEERGVELTTVDRHGAVQQAAEIDAEDVDHLDGGFIGADGAQRLQMDLAGLGGDDEELANACPLLPGFDKFVHHPVKRPSPERRPARKGPGSGVYPVLHCRRSRDPEARGEIVRYMFDDDGIAAKR